MDTDLFQILTLILLLGLLLTLFGVLQSLGAIRRTLEGRETVAETPASATPEPAPEATSRGDEPGTWAHPSATEREAAAEPAAAERAPARTGWPSPQEAAAAPEPATSAAEPAEAASGASGGARVLYGDSGLATATPSESALQPSGTEASSAAERPAASAGGQGQAEPAATGTSAAEDPQEQPFERDGRWWFRRGDELLVYEEQSGQWVAAAEPSSSGSVAAPAAATATAPEPAVGSAQGEVTTQHEAVGSFWKCPSCGAVNGSTATSCRMCFTARP